MARPGLRLCVESLGNLQSALCCHCGVSPSCNIIFFSTCLDSFINYLLIFSGTGSSLPSAGFSLVVVSGGCFLNVPHGLLIVVASLVVEHRLSSCGGQAWLVYSMKTPSGPVMNPCALHQQADSHPSYHQRSPSNCLRFLQSPVSFKL